VDAAEELPARLDAVPDDLALAMRALRREPLGSKPVVVYCTTENDIAHITEAIGAGANEYLVKPVDREILEAKLVEAGLMSA